MRTSATCERRSQGTLFRRCLRSALCHGRLNSAAASHFVLYRVACALTCHTIYINTVIQPILVQFNLAVLYRTGSKASPADFDKAVQWHGPIVAYIHLL